MELHHLGYACYSIDEALSYVKSLYDIEHISEIIFDERQNAYVCLIEVKNGPRIELVSGEPVKGFLEKNINYYHICYEVNDLTVAINEHKNNGAIQISEPKPARLFNDRLVVFLQTDLGLIELLEKEKALNLFTEKARIIITSSFITSTIDKAIVHLFSEFNLDFEIKHAPYNQVFQQLLDPTSIIRNNSHGFNIILIRFEDWVHYKPTVLEKDFFQIIEENTSELFMALKNAGNTSTCSYLLYICPPSPALLSNEIEKKFLQQMEIHLSAKIATIHGVSCITSHEIQSKYIIENYFDSHTNQLGHIPYTPEFEAVLGLMITRKIHSIRRPVFKVIVVDCDQTLWDGVCGELGAHEIQFNSANLGLQKFLVEQQERGILLCICSKNQLKDVYSVFENRPEMLLKKNHITEWCVNWNDKSKNINDLSHKLNLDLESFIFIDDNPIECAEAQLNCPKIIALEFLKKDLNISNFLNNWIFDQTASSSHSKIRNVFYKQTAERKNAEKNFSSLKEFLSSLNLFVDISPITPSQLKRAAELTHRTNQFNTTTIRYKENEIVYLISQGSSCLIVRANDRFGNYGLIGFVLYHIQNNNLIIDNLLISCRALGRGIEHQIISKLGETAQEQGIEIIKVSFIKTEKNLPALNFLNNSAFKKTKDGNYLFFIIKTDNAINIRYNPENEGVATAEPITRSKQSINYLPQLISKYSTPQDLLKAISLKNSNYEHNEKLHANEAIEDYLARIVKELLRISSITITQNFFELGMDSLITIQLIAKICRHLGIYLTIRDIFDTQNIFSLCKLIASKKMLSAPMPIKKTESPIPASHPQQQLWFLHQLVESSWHYNMPSAFRLRGDLNIQALKLALELLSERHESLRTTFKNINGRPYQIIHPSPLFSFSMEEAQDFSDKKIKEMAESEAKKIFDLENGPLFRVRLIKLQDKNFILFITKHHLIFDGLSYGIMNRELSQLYEAFSKNHPHALHSLTSQYTDFTLWQKNHLDSGVIEEQLIYWEKKLKNLPILNFPTDHPRPKKQTYNGKYLPIILPENICENLKIFSSEHKVTLFSVLFSVFSILISKYSGQSDYPIGIPVSGRQAPHTENLIGYFINTLVLRIDLNDTFTFLQHLKQVQNLIIEAQDNQDCPFDIIVERVSAKRDLSCNPLFQILFSYQNPAPQSLELFGLEVEALYEGYDVARVDITLELINSNGLIKGGIYYNSDLFNHETIAEIGSSFKNLLKEACLNPTKSMLTLSLVDENEKINLLSKYTKNNFNDTPISILDLFEKQVKLNPNGIALQYHKTKITYSELHSRSNELAHSIYRNSKNNIVAIALDRSLELVITILACMKAGLTYVPLDPHYPEERLKYILEDTKAGTLITKTKFNKSFNNFKNTLINLDISQSADQNKENLELTNDPENIAYIIYTSGTTGNPKGVMVSYKSLSNLISTTDFLYQFCHSDTIALFHSCTFDISIWEMWTGLCYGARLLMLPLEATRSSVELYRLIVEEKITILNITPSAFNQLVIHQTFNNHKTPSDLRFIILAGEALKPRELLPWLKENGDGSPKIINMYGITETTIYSTFAHINQTIARTNKSIIGQPIPGVQIYILDSGLNPVPKNVIGEIYIGGHGLAKGYLNNPELTQEKFISHPFLESQRIYKTGDLARFLNNDTIEYIGRSDTQIKLRGYRVELAEIENVLSQHEAVSSVLVRQTSFRENVELIAYVIPNPDLALPIRGYYELQKNNHLANKNLTTLPNGMLIAHLNKSETDLLYEEIFLNKEYYKNSISIKPGDTILDVGANIGLFSLFILQSYPYVNLYAFEPIPAIFEILETNSKLYGSKITCLNYGLAAENKIEIFDYYPNISVLSSRYANLTEESELLKHSILERNKIHTNEINDEEINTLIKDRLTSIATPCRLKSLSDFICERHISQIDLLKIDVEKSELDVLTGIKPEDWRKIKQIIIEVHDRDGTLDKIVSLLKNVGYEVLVEHDIFYQGTNLALVYASLITNLNSQKKQAVKNPLLFKWNSPSILKKELLTFLEEKIPKYMIPNEILFLNNFPVTQNGKLDISSLPINIVRQPPTDKPFIINDKEKCQVADIWQNILKIKITDLNANFFDLGGNSLLIMQVHSQLLSIFPEIAISVTDLFNYPSIEKLTAFIKNKLGHLSSNKISFSEPSRAKRNDYEIAVIGMAVRFPGANNVEEFWQLLRNGKETINHFTDAELTKYGVAAELLEKNNFIRAGGMIENLDQFDAEFFGYSSEEASLMDPQHRIFLETAWNALEVSGYTSTKYSGEIGIYAGLGSNDYQQKLWLSKKQNTATAELLIQLNNEKDYLSTRVAYKMGLTGSALNINTACSTSLVSVVKACQSLLLQENDIVLAGGVSLIMPFKAGYLYERDGIFSADGHCRSFDNQSTGTVPSSGVGVIVLKRLCDALKDGDNIDAIITGYAVNNDGSDKVSFTAPSIKGQKNCILKSQAMAQISFENISYIETHGSGTTLGDPIEIAALTAAFGQTTKKQFCAIGSVKTNIGHTQTAAGIAGLIKTILMLKHREIPPSLHYKQSNSKIDFPETPFFVNTKLTQWGTEQSTLVAAVNSFGLGGTNAHVILQSAPNNIEADSCYSNYTCLILSAKTTDALRKQTENLNFFLQDALASNFVYDSYLNDLAFTLQLGRTDFNFRRAWICLDIKDAINKLSIKNEDIIYDSSNLNPHYLELVAMAKNWVNHEPVNWNKLDNTGRRRIPLPTYPFAYKRFWHEPSNNKEIVRATHIDNKSLNRITHILSNIFKKILGQSSINADEDFFGLGGDSLSGLSLLLQIEYELGAKISLSDLLIAKDINSIARIVFEMLNSPQQESQVIQLKGGNSNQPLFLIHPGNGELHHYQTLIHYLKTKKSIFGIENLLNTNENNFSSIQEMAIHYIKLIKTIQPKGPYLLSGWSFGGVIAFEIARQLEHHNETVTSIFLYDSWAKHSPRFKNEEFFRKIYSSKLSETEYSPHQAIWLTSLWNRAKLLFEYQPKMIKANIILFKATILNEEYADMDERFNHWKKLTSGKIQVVNIPGNHTSILHSTNAKKIAAIQLNQMDVVQQ